MRRLLTAAKLSDEENLLYFLVKRDSFVRATFFMPIGLSSEALLIHQEKRRLEGARSAGIPVSQILIEARRQTTILKHPAVGVEHLLLALLSYETPDSELLRSAGITPEIVAARIKKGISFATATIGIARLTYYKAPARKHRG